MPGGREWIGAKSQEDAVRGSYALQFALFWYTRPARPVACQVCPVSPILRNNPPDSRNINMHHREQDDCADVCMSLHSCPAGHVNNLDIQKGLEMCGQLA